MTTVKVPVNCYDDKGYLLYTMEVEIKYSGPASSSYKPSATSFLKPNITIEGKKFFACYICASYHLDNRQFSAINMCNKCQFWGNPKNNENNLTDKYLEAPEVHKKAQIEINKEIIEHYTDIYPEFDYIIPTGIIEFVFQNPKYNYTYSGSGDKYEMCQICEQFVCTSGHKRRYTHGRCMRCDRCRFLDLDQRDKFEELKKKLEFWY